MGSAHLWLAFLLRVPQGLNPENWVFKMGSAHPWFSFGECPKYEHGKWVFEMGSAHLLRGVAQVLNPENRVF